MSSEDLDWKDLLKNQILFEPICDKEVLYEERSEQYNQLIEISKQGDFEKLKEYFKKHKFALVNCSELVSTSDRVEKGLESDLNTPLHHLVTAGGSYEALEYLTDHGALRSLKNRKGQTPHAIALEKGCDEKIVSLLAPPSVVLDNIETINLMEASVQKVVLNRVPTLIQERGIALPQIAPLWEKKKRTYFYEVPEMYGGFHLTLEDGKAGTFFVTCESFIRIMGGSEEKCVVDSTGKIQERHWEVNAYRKKPCCHGCCVVC